MGGYRSAWGHFQETLRIRSQASLMRGALANRTAKEQRLSAASSKTVYWLRTRVVFAGLFSWLFRL